MALTSLMALRYGSSILQQPWGAPLGALCLLSPNKNNFNYYTASDTGFFGILKTVRSAHYYLVIVPSLPTV